MPAGPRRIGLDFDNTIIRYDEVFRQVAVGRGLVPADLPPTKTAVRDFLRRAGREPAWTELQGVVYGPGIGAAEPFPGVLDFFRACRRDGMAVCIISHKTRVPYAGEPHDLHAAAMGWLEAQGFFRPDGIGLARADVWFEETKAGKLARIAERGCTHFLDDLPELLTDPAFPAIGGRCLFDPGGGCTLALPFPKVASWAEFGRLVGVAL
ncbi:MAG: haloacid dehalogenase-like hydrolase [Candidatus Riflebacteria bacterium]|nr:haloacid dehalogenase-like hydrolase [Candidatus Riflebacteria bacterium]